MISCSLFVVLFWRCNIWIKNAPWLPRTGTACNALKFTFVHLTYYFFCQQLPDATNPPKKIMTLRHMYSTGALHMVGSNEQHVQGCSMRQTDVHCFTEWVVCLCTTSSSPDGDTVIYVVPKKRKVYCCCSDESIFCSKALQEKSGGVIFF